MFRIQRFGFVSQDYEQFIMCHPLNAVSQSQYWGQMQAKVPSRGKYIALACYDEYNTIVGVCTLVRHKMGKNMCYLYAHRGPVWNPEIPQVFDCILQEMHKIAKEEDAVFVRCDPLLGYQNSEELASHRRFFQDRGFVAAHAQYQPLTTLQIDLTQNEDDIFSQMSQTGRRNIRKGDKAGLDIYVSDNNDTDIQDFYDLMEETTKRDGFYGHEKTYYQKLLQGLWEAQTIDGRLYMAKKDGKLLAAAIVTMYGNTAIYYYGASSSHMRNLMAPYILHWRIMQDAKAYGCQVYDWLGILPDVFQDDWGRAFVYMGNETKYFSTMDVASAWLQNKHPFAGITLFKTRFGGCKQHYVGAFEYVYKPIQYSGLLQAKKMRKWLRKTLGVRV